MLLIILVLKIGKKFAVADNIIDRLQCTYRKDEWPCEACTFCAARAEIERLREQVAEMLPLFEDIVIGKRIRERDANDNGHRTPLGEVAADFGIDLDADTEYTHQKVDILAGYTHQNVDGARPAVADDMNIIEQAEANAQAMRDEIERLRAIVATVDDLHSCRLAHDTCLACYRDWPCPTHLLIHPKEACRG